MRVAELNIVHRTLDRTAIGMADDGDQFRTRSFAGEFHAAENVVVQHIARDARAENIADALIENNFNSAAASRDNSRRQRTE